MMATRTVGMAVFKFVLRRSADFGNLDLEHKIASCEWMVRIQGDVACCHCRHHHDRIFLAGAAAEHVADFHFLGGKLVHGNIRNQGLVTFAVSVFSLHVNFALVALDHGHQHTLQTRDDLARAFQAAFGRPLYAIGQITGSMGMELVDAAGNMTPIVPTGWDHFKGP